MRMHTINRIRARLRHSLELSQDFLNRFSYSLFFAAVLSPTERLGNPYMHNIAMCVYVVRTVVISTIPYALPLLYSYLGGCLDKTLLNLCIPLRLENWNFVKKDLGYFFVPAMPLTLEMYMGLCTDSDLSRRMKKKHDNSGKRKKTGDKNVQPSKRHWSGAWRAKIGCDFLLDSVYKLKLVSSVQASPKTAHGWCRASNQKERKWHQAVWRMLL